MGLRQRHDAWSLCCRLLAGLGSPGLATTAILLPDTLASSSGAFQSSSAGRQYSQDRHRDRRREPQFDPRMLAGVCAERLMHAALAVCHSPGHLCLAADKARLEGLRWPVSLPA